MTLTNSNSNIADPSQIARKIERLRVKAFQATDTAKKNGKLFLITLVPLVIINIAITIGPAFIGNNASLLSTFAQVLGALNTAIVTFTSQFQFQAKRDKHEDKAKIYSSLATELENALLFPGFDKIYNQNDWFREVQKMGAYCGSVEKAVAAKIPDIVTEAKQEFPTHIKETKDKEKDEAQPKSSLSKPVSRFNSLKKKLSMRKTKSVQIDEEEKEEPIVNDLQKAETGKFDDLNTENDACSLDFSTDDEHVEIPKSDFSGINKV